jgi:hypothetical protein
MRRGHGRKPDRRLNEAAGAADAIREVRSIGRVACGSQGVPVTHLRQAMLEELQRRNHANTAVHYYIQAVERFAKYFRRGPRRSPRAVRV